MTNDEILAQIRDEYSQGFEYVKPKREQFRARINKCGNVSAKSKDKININMIANYLDVQIAFMYSDGIKTKFISRDSFLGTEEAENLTNVYEFDHNENYMQQINYQVEQDSGFFGVGIYAQSGWDGNRKVPVGRPISPMSWIMDPMPTRTGNFSAQAYRWHGFMMSTNIYDFKKREGIDTTAINQWISGKFDSDSSLTRQVYANKYNLTDPATLDTCHNFSMDVYYAYTILDGEKHLVITDSDLKYVFQTIKFEPVLVEEKVDSSLVPRPISLNYTEPERDNPFGKSIWDKVEDKQNAKSILFNLNVLKAKKEALGGTFLVNSRLIKNKAELSKPTTDTKYIFLSENIADETQISNAMYELPQSPIKTDTMSMINALEREADRDTAQDALQAGMIPDKTMTKAEAQQIQANANMRLTLRNKIKARYYRELAFLRWRAYQENFKAGQKKFIALNMNFEWKSLTFTKDNLSFRGQPYIVVGSKDDIEAISEKEKQYMNATLPIILNDPATPAVSKALAKRLTYRLNGLSPNQIYSICPMTADELMAEEYVYMVNNDIEPKSILSNPNADIFTYYLYLQKAKDCTVKSKILSVLKKMLIEKGAADGIQAHNQVANASANIQMAQNSQQSGDVVSRESL